MRRIKFWNGLVYTTHETLFFTLLTITVKQTDFPETLDMFLIRAFVAKNHYEFENIKVAINWYHTQKIKRLTGSQYTFYMMERKIPTPDKKTLEHMATLDWNDLMIFMHKKYGKKFTQDFLRNYTYRLQKLKWRKNQNWK